MKKINLEIVVFFCGAVVMAFEIIGSRMLGPYVGTSMVVWSSIIGIILFSLSLGYYWGGRVADASPNYQRLSLIIGIAGLFIFLSLVLKNAILGFLTASFSSIYFVSILASLSLFALPAILLGMVSPFAARLRIRNRSTAGATVGYLYALSTLGSIAGTFLAGFYLIPGFRITTILVLLASLLLVLAIFLMLTSSSKRAIIIQENQPHEKN